MWLVDPLSFHCIVFNMIFKCKVSYSVHSKIRGEYPSDWDRIGSHSRMANTRFCSEYYSTSLRNILSCLLNVLYGTGEFTLLLKHFYRSSPLASVLPQLRHSMVIMMTTCCWFLHVCYWKCIDKPPQAMCTGWSTQFRPEQPDCMDHLVNNYMCVGWIKSS